MNAASGRPVFLTAEWRALLMVNFAVDPGLLRPHLPVGTELDLWEERALVSMVGFLFLDTRVCGISAPLHRDFEEVNLRFYVRRRTSDGWRRGVVFIKEIVPRRMIAAIARMLYGERYICRPMRHTVDLTPDSGGTVRYEWQDGGRWHALGATVSGSPAPMPAGSEAEFIFEHYWGYAQRRNGGTTEYEVQHDPWRIWEARDVKIDYDIAALYGSEWAGPLAAKPVSAFVADGSPVAVRWGRGIERA